MRPQRRIWVGLLLIVGAAVAALWMAVTGGTELLVTIRSANPLFLAAMLGVTVSWVFLRFLRWQFLLRRFGVRIPIRASVSSYLAGLAGTATPAYVGEVIRPVLIRRSFGVPLSLTLPVLVLERVLDVTVLAGLLALLGHGLPAQAGAIIVGGLLAVWLVTLWSLRGRSDRWAAVAAPRVVTVALALSILAWAAAGTLLTLASAAIGETLPLMRSVAIFSQATLGGAATLMPAGVGTTGSFAILTLQNGGFALVTAVSVVSLMRFASAGVALAVGGAALLRELRGGGAPSTLDGAEHFNDIAGEYGDQFSEHIWNHLLARKMGMISDALGPGREAGLGLDLGCGLGRQCRERRDAGYAVVGVDPAHGLLRTAQTAGVPVAAANGVALPFANGSLDFVFTVGVLHHVPGWSLQEEVIAEVARVLKPGGLFMVHETNPRNPLFRFYMSYVFPLLKSIDEGIEWWIPTARWSEVPGFEVKHIRYFTFIPDFLPQVLLDRSLALERRLERGRWAPYSVHYFAVLAKRDQAAGVPASAAAREIAHVE